MSFDNAVAARAPSSKHRRIAAALLLAFLGGVEMGGCCSGDTFDSCMTPEQWRTTHSCPDFPTPPAGQQCPSAEAFAKNCGEKVGRTHADGDKCCYEVKADCY